MSTSTRQRALRDLSDHQQQPHGPEFSVNGDELYTWLRAYLLHAGQRQRPDYAYDANRLYCLVVDTYRHAGNYIAIHQGQDFFDIAALYAAIQRTTRQNVLSELDSCLPLSLDTGGEDSLNRNETHPDAIAHHRYLPL